MRKNTPLIIIFISILFAPLFFNFLKMDPSLQLTEKRTLAKMPLIGVYKQFPGAFQTYFDDNFGLRNLLIETNNYFKLTILKTPVNSAVILGKNNWLYFAIDTNFLDFINAEQYLKTDLEAIRKNLEKTDAKLSSLGIEFYLLIAPSKQEVYPEYLPDYFIKVRSNSKLDTLTNYLQGNSKIKFINPKSSLIHGKKVAATYYKFDTHWNEYGGFLVFQEIIKRMKKDFTKLQPNSLNDFTVSYLPSKRKDLEDYLGVTNYYHETEPIFALTGQRINSQLLGTTTSYVGYPKLSDIQAGINYPRVLMFHDSFGVGLMPFLSNYFSQIIYNDHPSPYPLEIVKQEKPDVVIVELTERELWRLSNSLFE